VRRHAVAVVLALAALGAAAGSATSVAARRPSSAAEAVPNRQVVPAAVRLRAGAVLVVPDTPSGGRPVRASMRVTRRDTGAAVRGGKVTCALRVGTKPLVLVRRGFRSGRPSCTWRLPASASGKHIAGWIRVDALGAFARRFFGRPVL
jgi:hypothetical protein